MDGSLTPAAQPPAWAARLFGSRLAPLSLGADGGVAVWGIADGSSSAKISEQFKANAGDYHARYGASSHFEGLFRQALAKTGAEIAPEPFILDLGSGSGVNSIVPCFSLFPGARQVATDLSGELLAILADYAAQTGVADRVICVVMDAMEHHVTPRQFDLVTGAAILHHLERPNLALLAAARALKPGGRAIFFEPFDGYGVLRLAYERFLAEADLRGQPLDPAIAAAFRTMIADIAARTAPDRNAPGFAELDDKWLFPRENIEVMARNAGFVAVEFVPLNDHESLYLDSTAVQLKLFSGRDVLLLPDWAVDILKGFDRALPPQVKRLLMLEGAIVLTKGATVGAAATPSPEAMSLRARAGRAVRALLNIPAEQRLLPRWLQHP